MKTQIISELQNIEIKNDITVLYACESGSRAWGFDNDESDYDVRFIFRRNNLRDYLSLSLRDDVIEVMDGDLDIVGWDIKKALILHRKSNPNLREWIKSPMKYIDLKTDIFKGLPDFDSAVLKYHYSSIVRNNWKMLSRNTTEITPRIIKMYLYSCRCILTWMALDNGADPSINIFDLLNQEGGLDMDMKNEVLELIGYYRNGCRNEVNLKNLETIGRWIENSLAIMELEHPEKDGLHDISDYDERFFELVFQEDESFQIQNQ